MNLLRSLTAIALALVAQGVSAQEQAFTNRSTELREQAAGEARVIETLKENTPVKEIGRAHV